MTFQYCCRASGVPDFATGTTLDAWPQPFTTLVNLRAASALVGSRVEIFDLAGRRVGTLRLHSGLGTWETGDLPAGIYLARVADVIGSEPVKLIKLR